MTYKGSKQQIKNLSKTKFELENDKKQTTKHESKLNMGDMATNNDLDKPDQFDNRRFEGE